MAATRWKTIKVIVQITVRDDSLSEKDFRWVTEQALNTHRTFYQVMELYRERGYTLRNLIVKVFRNPRDG